MKRHLASIERLTDFAVKYRYPGAWATAPQKREARSTARTVRALLRKALHLK